MSFVNKNMILIEELEGQRLLLGDEGWKAYLMRALAPVLPPRTLSDVCGVVALSESCSLVIGKEIVYRCEIPPERLLIEVLEAAYHADIEAYRRTVKMLIDRISYKIPLATAEFVLFPLTGNSCTIWLNPAHIDAVTETFTTFIQLTNGLLVEIPIKRRSFWELALNAVIVYVVIKREYDPMIDFSIHDLHDYLGLTHTSFTNDLIQKLKIENYLLPRGTFHHCFEQWKFDLKLTKTFG